MSLIDIDQVSRVYSVPPVGHASLTVFAEGRVRRSPQLCKHETGIQMSNFQPVYSNKTVQPDNSWLVNATENITLAPRCKQIVLGKRVSEGANPPPLVCMDPIQIPIMGILFSRALSRVEPGTQEPSRVTSPGSHTVTRVSNSCVLLLLANFSDESLTIPKTTIVSLAEQIAEPLVNEINTESKSDTTSPAKPRRKRKNQALCQKLLHGKLQNLLQGREKLNRAHTFIVRACLP